MAINPVTMLLGQVCQNVQFRSYLDIPYNCYMLVVYYKYTKLYEKQIEMLKVPLYLPYHVKLYEMKPN